MESGLLLNGLARREPDLSACVADCPEIRDAGWLPVFLVAARLGRVATPRHSLDPALGSFSFVPIWMCN